MIGKLLENALRRERDRRRLAALPFRVSPFALRSSARAGFTMLELIIVISIIIILLMVVIPQYQRVTLYGREAVLRQNLNEMRRMLDHYSADKGKLPQTLDDLVSAGYLREVPVDPITGERDWQTETGPDPFSANSESGIINVRSAAPGTSSDGTPYNQW